MKHKKFNNLYIPKCDRLEDIYVDIDRAKSMGNLCDVIGNAVECSSFSCSECILRNAHSDTFEEYMRSKEKTKSCPQFEGKHIPITKEGKYITFCNSGLTACTTLVPNSCATCVLDYTNPNRDAYLKWVVSMELEQELKPKSPNELMQEVFGKVEVNCKTGKLESTTNVTNVIKPITKESKMHGKIYQVIAVENPAPIEVEERAAVSKIVFGPVTILAANESTAITQATLSHVKELTSVNQERLEVKAIPLG